MMYLTHIHNTSIKKIVLDISVKSLSWKSLNFDISKYCKKVIKAVMLNVIGEAYINKSINIKVSLLLADNKSLYGLNKQYRDKKSVTNVLSFPFFAENKDYIINLIKASKGLFLGDIAISHEKVLEESLQQEKSFIEHFTYILIHGILHLLGYDHVSDEEAIKMEKLEVRIMKSLGL